MKHGTLVSAAAMFLGVAGCSDYLTGGELGANPNLPQVATNPQLFVGVHANVFYTYGGVLPRVGGIFAQHWSGSNLYTSLDQYSITSSSDEGAFTQIAAAGGLLDVRRLQASAAASGDSVFLGMAQVEEALLIGMAADVYGDLVYTNALKNSPNPPLDRQLAVFDSLQALLSRAITNMSATGSTNAGPRGADVSFKGDPVKWVALAHSLKARFQMHTAEVRGTAAYQAALAEVSSGILAPANDYKAVFGGGSGDQNSWGSWVLGVRAGYLVPGHFMDSLLKARNDPRRSQYYKIDATKDSATDLSAARAVSTFPQPIVTASETQLTWAEAAYRTGDQATAFSHLNTARSFVTGLAPEPAGLSGAALLQEILIEEYINDFQLGVEAWKLYRRTCYPNVANRSPGGSLPMPGRLYYSASEVQTNTSMPAAGTDPNGIRNQDDPSNAAPDVGGGSCRAGA